MRMQSVSCPRAKLLADVEMTRWTRSPNEVLYLNFCLSLSQCLKACQWVYWTISCACNYEASINFIRTICHIISVPVGKEEGRGLGTVTTCLLCKYMLGQGASLTRSHQDVEIMRLNTHFLCTQTLEKMPDTQWLDSRSSPAPEDHCNKFTLLHDIVHRGRYETMMWRREENTRWWYSVEERTWGQT